MTELNATQKKHLDAITPFIKDIQIFVDANICNGVAMPSKTIHEKFSKEYTCTLDQVDFINGFRAAVAAQKITGIVGRKRAGYKRIGDETKPTASDEETGPEPSSLDPYIENLQKWVSQRITGEVRMTAATIFSKFREERGCGLIGENEFVTEFRLAIKNKKITGLESAYRLGYKQAGLDPKPEGTENTDSKTTKPGYETCEIIIDHRRKIIAADKYNWAYMVRKDSGTWHTEAFFNKAKSTVKGIAAKLLDDELKGMPSFNIKDLGDKIDEATARIAELITQAIQKPMQQASLLDEALSDTDEEEESESTVDQQFIDALSQDNVEEE